uniref:Uncharacterized protein n=1 Tax=Vespula pensylvanica TaxID=30213 RepID=A0A834MYW1_VESPE|nr:hypothetical protein H0235_017597 [Vespula pensylvanica]
MLRLPKGIFCNNLLNLYLDFMKSTKVFPLVSEFNSNLPRHMKPKSARKAPNYPVYGNPVTPLPTHYYSNHQF